MVVRERRKRRTQIRTSTRVNLRMRDSHPPRALCLFPSQPMAWGLGSRDGVSEASQQTPKRRHSVFCPCVHAGLTLPTRPHCGREGKPKFIVESKNSIPLTLSFRSQFTGTKLGARRFLRFSCSTRRVAVIWTFQATSFFWTQKPQQTAYGILYPPRRNAAGDTNNQLNRCRHHRVGPQRGPRSTNIRLG